MPPLPPEELVAIVEKLNLATPRQVRRLGFRARRLARRLPMFTSVWIDALVQARILTPFQAGEIEAGRGEDLRVGGYVLCRPLPSAGFAATYVAREIDSPRLARINVLNADPEALARIKALIAPPLPLDSSVLAPAIRVGVEAGRVWVSSRHVEGRTADEWLVRLGRFPPALVLHIARKMLTGLRSLEQSGLCHADIGPWSLILTERGEVVLAEPGLRAAVRPDERGAQELLQSEAYDYIAPDRVLEGEPPSVASDLYACGCLWWHLLTGRSPIRASGGLAKIQALKSARIPDVTEFAPDTPAPLAAAIAVCVDRDPARRPQSARQVIEMLGPPARASRAALRRYFGPQHRFSVSTQRLALQCIPARKTASRPSWLTATAGWLLAGAAIVWAGGGPRAPDSVSISLVSPGGPSDERAFEPSGTLATDRDCSFGFEQFVEDRSASPHADGQSSPGARRIAAAGLPAHNVQQVAPASASDRVERTDDLVLPAGEPLEIASLALRPGQVVRGQPGRRPLVLVPRGGLVVAVEGVCFEDIDFSWQQGNPAPDAEEVAPAIVHVLASRAEFRRCSFTGPAAASDPPAALRWTYPGDRAQAECALLSGRLLLSDCVLRRVGVGVACETLGAPAVEMGNLLHLGAGPLVQLDHAPEPDEPVLISLSGVTLRGAGPVLECVYQRISDRPAGISIEAGGCVLAIRADASLLSFVGPTPPERLLGRIRWSGQGSLVLPETTIAAWHRPQGPPRTLDDALASIAGLVRSRVDFAGPEDDGPEASQVLRWQAPLRSSNPPGIDPQTIAWPKQHRTALAPPERPEA